MAIHTHEQFHTAFVERFNRADIDGTMVLYEEDASLIPQLGLVMHDRESNRHALQKFLP